MRVKNILLVGTMISSCFFSGCHDEPDYNLNKDVQWPVNIGTMVNGEIPEVGDVPEYSEIPHDPYCRIGRYARVEYITDTKARLILGGDKFDLGSVYGNPFRGEVSVPGIIPGSRETSLEIELVPSTKGGDWIENEMRFHVKLPKQYFGKRFSFKGEAETDKIIYEYKGFIEGGEMMTLRLNVIDYKTGAISEGLWITKDFNWDSHNNKPTDSPFVVEWETQRIPAEMDGMLEPANLLQLILTTKFLPANAFGLDSRTLISLYQLLKVTGPVIEIKRNQISLYNLSMHIRDVDPTYISFNSILPTNTITYIPLGNEKLNIFINPGGLYEMEKIYYYSTHGSQELHYSMNTPNIYGLFSKILMALSPKNAEGLTTDFNLTESSLNWNLSDSKLCSDLIASTILSLLQNEVCRKRLLRSIAENDEVAHLLNAVEKGIDSFEDMIRSTKEMRLGIAATPISKNDQEKLLECWGNYYWN